MSNNCRKAQGIFLRIYTTYMYVNEKFFHAHALLRAFLKCYNIIILLINSTPVCYKSLEFVLIFATIMYQFKWSY